MALGTCPDRQLDGDHVPGRGDAIQLTVDVREELGHADEYVTELLAPIALLADDVVEHAVFGKAANEPGDVHHVALRHTVRVPNDCLVVVGHLISPRFGV